MRKALFFTLFLSMIGGCFHAEQKASIKDRYQNLLSKFKDVSFDTLVVYSLNDQVDLDKYRFKGVQLDSSEAVLFPSKISEAYFNDPPGLFACCKFKLDSNRTGLIARTPSEYFPSSVKLFIYTNDKDTLVEAGELAQYIGDAGALRDINSWIYKEKGSIKVFTWLRDNDDNSAEEDNPKDTMVTVSDNFSIYNTTNNKLDSLGTKIDQLPVGLKQLIEEKAIR